MPANSRSSPRSAPAVQGRVVERRLRFLEDEQEVQDAHVRRARRSRRRRFRAHPPADERPGAERDAADGGGAKRLRTRTTAVVLGGRRCSVVSVRAGPLIALLPPLIVRITPLCPDFVAWTLPDGGMCRADASKLAPVGSWRCAVARGAGPRCVRWRQLRRRAEHTPRRASPATRRADRRHRDRRTPTRRGPRPRWCGGWPAES